MKIKALVPFSNGTISMEQYEVREVTDTLGNQLIAAGVAIEIGGGTGGGVLIVTETVDGLDSTLSATYKQIADAGFCVRDVINGGNHQLAQMREYGHPEENIYYVTFFGDPDEKAYVAASENDYPVYHVN